MPTMTQEEHTGKIAFAATLHATEQSSGGADTGGYKPPIQAQRKQEK